MSAIGSITGNSGAASSADAFSTMSSEDFVKVMFTELTNQDPLAPSESKDLLEQIGTIRSIESDVELKDVLNNMSRNNEIASSSTLVGKFVTGKSEGGFDVAGYVDSVSITAAGPVLNLGSGFRVSLADLGEIVDPVLLDGDGGNEPPIMSNEIPDQIATIGQPWEFTFGPDTFSDEESTASLTYSATLADGSTLPAWLEFSSNLRRFSGTPGIEDQSPVEVKVTAIDSQNARGSTSFGLTLLNETEG